MSELQNKPAWPVPLGLILPVTDALHTVRFSLRRGRKRISDLDLDQWPGGSVATGVLRRADCVAQDALHGMSSVARSILVAAAGDTLRLPQPVEPLIVRGRRDPERTSVHFAAAAHDALGSALLRLGARDGLISETRLRAAYQAALRRGAFARHEPAVQFAASLVSELLTRDAIAEVSGQGGLVGGRAEAMAQQAAFALGLALVAASDATDAADDPDELLQASADLTAALADQMPRSRGDIRAIAAFLHTYGDKV
jgi:hypothetical protein